MTKGLSKREKVLISIAAVFALSFILFKFAIIPTYNNYMSKQEELDSLYYQKMLLEIKLQSEASVHENYDKAQKTYDAIIEQYPSVIPNEEIDRLLTGICLQNSMSVTSLKISNAIDYIMSQEESESKGISQNSAAFTIVKANMSLKGEYDSLKNLIDTVERIDYIRISQISYSRNKDTDSSSISITFEVMMFKDTQ